MTNPDARMNAIVSEHSGVYTDVFEKVYVAAAAGEGDVPWSQIRARHHWLREWAAEQQLDGTGKKALVVGCGYGFDAEFVATLGYATTAFDVSPTAIELTRGKHPGSPVGYVVADLLSPPEQWTQAFDLVVEICTVQALPRSMRRDVTDAIGSFVAPDGRLIVLGVIQQEPFTDGEFGPWPMTRAEVDAFAGTGLRAVHVEERPNPDHPEIIWWVADYQR